MTLDKRSNTRHAESMRFYLPCLLAVLLAGCAATTAAPAPANDRLARLLDAEPAAWSERLAEIAPLTADEAMAAPGRAAARPTAPGAPAVLALLGRSPQPTDDVTLIALVADGGNLATDAALALGERHCRAAVDVCRAAMRDAAADPTLRTACGLVLARSGHGREAAPFLRAVLLGGSPAGAPLAAEHALPDRPRWALERYLVQRMLLREGAVELARELDPDASWPVLEQVAERVVQWLAAR